MANQIVHAEIIGPDPDTLREFYSELFGWSAKPGDPVASDVSAPGLYSFNPLPEGSAVPVGIGGGPGFAARALFYVGVADVDAALARAVTLGATVTIAATNRPDGRIRVAQFADPAGSTIGIAGPA